LKTIYSSLLARAPKYQKNTSYLKSSPYHSLYTSTSIHYHYPQPSRLPFIASNQPLPTPFAQSFHSNFIALFSLAKQTSVEAAVQGICDRGYAFGRGHGTVRQTAGTGQAVRWGGVPGACAATFLKAVLPEARWNLATLLEEH
jgi:hypothetical protein